MKDPELWHRIEQMNFAGKSDEDFARSVERVTQWAPEVCLAAIGEYRRFLYLWALYDFEIRPPKPIAEIMLAHSGFQSYWDELENAIGRLPRHRRRRVALSRRKMEFAYAMEFDHFPPPILWAPSGKWVERGLMVVLVLVLTLCGYAFGDLFLYAAVVVGSLAAYRWPNRGPTRNRVEPDIRFPPTYGGFG